MIYWYRFTGYPAYRQYRKEIKDRITTATEDEDLNYYLAVNEAVCNAARYGTQGVLETAIQIKLKIEPDALQTKIFSSTKAFDMMAYRNQLRALAQDETTKSLDWDKWLQDADHGRGIWLMLAACDFICMEKNGQFIELHTPLPFQARIVKTQIGHLVSRFFIDDRGLIV